MRFSSILVIHGRLTLNMAIAHVQTLDASMAADGGATQTRTVTWTGGNLGVICAWGYLAANSPEITGVVGSSSGTWTVAKQGGLNNNRRGEIWYKENITGGADTVTVTWNVSLDGGSVVTASEYSGVATSSSLDYTASTEGAGSNTTPSITLVPSTSNQLLVAFLHVLGTSTISTTYTQRSERESFMYASIQDTTASGSTAMTWTLGTANYYSMVGATFKPAPTTSIKTINGLALASVKTVNGLAIASVKTVNGLA